MASVNKVILIGHLGRDPETRYTSGGEAVCNFSIATNESWKDKASGEKREATEWHKIVTYRKLAEIAGQYLKKGSQVYIEGKLKTRKWTDKDGQDRYTTEIEATEFQMLGGRGQGSNDSQQQGGSGSDYAPAPAPQQKRQAPPKPSFDDLGDDIPF